jgi:carbon-monoxide dehydrogenase medium subunit
MLVAVHIPGASARSLSFFDEIARRRGDYAMAGLAAWAQVSAGRFGGARFVFFGVGEKPLSARAVHGYLEGRRPEAVDVDAAAQAICADIEPMADLTTSAEAKAHLIRVLAARALRQFAAKGA